MGFARCRKADCTLGEALAFAVRLILAAMVIGLCRPATATAIEPPSVDVVAIGDSITVGYGATYPEDAWPAVLAQLTGLNVSNKGVGGNTTGQMRERFDMDVIAESPDSVIVAGGLNDFFSFVPFSTIQDNLRSMVETAHAAGIHPYLATITPNACFDPRTVALLNEWIRDYARQTPGVGLVDFHPALEDPAGSGSTSTLIDIVHLNSRGYRIMGAAAANALSPQATPIGPDRFVAARDQTAAIGAPGVLANDGAWGGAPYGSAATLVAGPLHGTLELAADGGFAYRPDPGYCGLDRFYYRVLAGSAYSLVASATIDVRQEVTPPVTRLLGAPASWSPTSAVLSIEATDSPVGSGVSATFYRLGHGKAIRYSSPFAISFEGTNTIEYWSIDVAGNTEPTQTANVTLDLTPPRTASDATPQYYRSATIHLTATDSLSGVARVQLRLDGGAWTTGNVCTTTAVGNHVLVFRSADRAGNVEGTRTVFFHVDSKPRAELTNARAPYRVRVSSAVTAYGYLRPQHPAGARSARIYIWKRTPAGSWRPYYSYAAAVSDQATYSKYSRRFYLPSRGVWRIRAYAPEDSRHAATWSNGYTYMTVY